MSHNNHNSHGSHGSYGNHRSHGNHSNYGDVVSSEVHPNTGEPKTIEWSSWGDMSNDEFISDSIGKIKELRDKISLLKETHGGGTYALSPDNPTIDLTGVADEEFDGVGVDYIEDVQYDSLKNSLDTLKSHLTGRTIILNNLDFGKIVADNRLESTTMDCSMYDNVKVEVYMEAVGLNSSEYGHLLWFDGTEWHLLKEIGNGGGWYTLDVPQEWLSSNNRVMSDLTHAASGVILSNGNAHNEHLYVGSLKVYNEGPGSTTGLPNKDEGSIIDNEDFQLLKSEIDNLASYSVSAQYSNHANHGNHGNHDNHGSHGSHGSYYA